MRDSRHPAKYGCVEEGCGGQVMENWLKQIDLLEKPLISIIVPTYNEEGNVEQLLKRIDVALAGTPYEVIIVDDASVDKTTQLALSARISGKLKVFQKRRRGGKAESLVIGLELAEGHYVTFLDADMEYPPEVLPRMLKLAAETGADVVAAARRDRRPLHRRAVSTGARILTKLLVPQLRKLKDPTTELVLARKEAMADFEQYARYIKPITAALSEAIKAGAKVVESSVEVTPRQRGRSSFKYKWVLSYTKQLMDLSGWFLPKYIAVALIAALIARSLNPLIGPASLAVSVAIIYLALRPLIGIVEIAATKATSTALKLLTAPIIGNLGLYAALAVQLLMINLLRR